MKKFLIIFLVAFIIHPKTMDPSSNGIHVQDFTMETPSGVRLGFNDNPSTSMVVSWWTSSSNTDSMVYYGKSPAGLTNELNGTIRAVDTGSIHDVNLIGLESDTKYYYKCGGGSGNSSIYNFTTAPSPRSRGIHFVAYGDTRSNYERRRLVRNMVLTRGNDEFNTDPEFALNSGDVVAHGEIQEEYDNYSIDMEPLSSTIPIMHVAGNHDDDVASTYPLQFSEPTNGNDGWYYSFDWGPVHFVAMNTETKIADGYLDSSFLSWLENDLKETRANEDILWIIGLFHKPLYVSFSHTPEYSLWWEWNGLFTEYGVDLLFNGHSHAYQRNYPINDNGILSKNGDPNYVNPPYPIHVVSGAGAVHSESYTQDDLRNDTYHATWDNGDYVFFPSNHFCNVNITVDKESLTTRLQMNVIGLNYSDPNITETNFSTHVVDRMSITKDIPSGYFVEEEIPLNFNSVVAFTLSFILASSAVVLEWKRRKRKALKKKKERERNEVTSTSRIS